MANKTAECPYEHSDNHQGFVFLNEFQALNIAAEIIIAYPTKLNTSGKSPNIIRLKIVVNMICE